MPNSSTSMIKKSNLSIALVNAILLLISFSVERSIAQCTPPLATPVGLAVGYVDCDSVSFSWTPPPPPFFGGYHYQVTQSPTPGIGTGTFTTSFAIGQGSLIPSSTYYIHLRRACTPYVSGWVTVSFSTSACCTTPGNISPVPTSTSVSLTWTTVAGAIGYEFVVDQSTGTPGGQGTNSTVPSANKSGLTPNTAYYVHVRTQCNATDFSPWSAPVSFTTPTICDIPTNISPVVTSNNVNLTWSAVSGAISYEYVVDQSSLNPANAGIVTAVPNGSKGNLFASTTYYAHVRCKCSASNLSSWSPAISFNTPPPTFLIEQTSLNAGFMQVYPNPAKDEIHALFNDTSYGDAFLRIFSIDGRLIKSLSVTGTEMIIDLSKFATGSYLMEYRDQQKVGLTRIDKL